MTVVHDPQQESSAPAVLWFAALAIAATAPGLLWTSARNLGFHTTLFATVTALSIVAASVVAGVLWLAFGRRMRWSLGVATVVMLTVFQWPRMIRIGAIVARRLSATFLADLLTVLLAIGLIWLAVRLASTWQFLAILGPAVLVTAGAMTFQAAALESESAPEIVISQAADTTPNVVILVLDAYGRADVLRDSYGVDSAEFLGELELQGFEIATEATANYNFTYASVATILDLDYIFEPGVVEEGDVQSLRRALSGDGDLLGRFKAAGYEIVYLENAWEGSRCGSYVDWCVRDGLLERGLWAFGQVSVAAPLVRELRSHPFHTVSLAQLESLSEIVNSPGRDEGPRITYAHVILPHPPYLLDENCDRAEGPARRTVDGFENVDLATLRANYAGQVECVNDILERELGELIAHDPDLVVMITGDHGPTVLPTEAPYLWTDDAVGERMTILSAYRLPGCDIEVPDDVTPVNGGRLVANCALDAGLELVPNRNYYAPPLARGETVEITAGAARS